MDRSALIEEMHRWKISKMNPVMLRKHRRSPTEIEPARPEDSDGVISEDDGDATADDGLDLNQLSTSAEADGKQGQDGLKQEETDIHHRLNGLPERSRFAPEQAHLESSDPRYGYPEVNQGTKCSLPGTFQYDNNYRRKSVCVHCWITRGFCDPYSQCGTCRVDRVQCVRKLCGSGLSCRKPALPLLAS